MSGPLTVVCVDDERMVLDSLRDQLRRHLGTELSIEVAESGEEALEVVEEVEEDGGRVAVVISDQLMPGMRGEALLARVHERDARVFNILLTGQATADAVGEAVNQARLYRYIGKPWAEDDLILTVREALRAYHGARALERQEEEARRAHRASLRFVPSAFLKLLGRERLVDVEFGDHVERPMHVLFADMRGYTRMVQDKTTAEAFAFVNTFMQHIDTAVSEHGGFVSNIEGDAVLALFPTHAADAIAAGIAAHRTLDAWNSARAARGEAAVEMGVAVNSGDLLLGTVGGEERLQCDVVGDAVNIASRIEALTKAYDARLLVADASLSDAHSLDVRCVECVQPRGSRHEITLYEVLDAQPEPTRRRRLATRDTFETAGQAFRSGDASAARQGYASVLQRDPSDGAARTLLSRCETRIREID